tara:strand:+ start:780 stop:1166 length:387 start_codon:yes stop_codon:yes gene_type:complete
LVNEMQNNDPQNIFTFISRSAPYGSNRPQLCLDIALTVTVFGQDVNLVFWGDGVLQLIKGQAPEAISSKSISSTLETLELYGIKDIYVDEAAMNKHKLKPSDLVIEAKPSGKEALLTIIERSSSVFNL